MNTYLKWFLGILLVLVVIAAIPLGMRYLIGNGVLPGHGMYPWHHDPGFDFDRPDGYEGWKDMHRFHDRGWDPRPYSYGFPAPFAFNGGLLKLVVFAGLLYGAYWLGKRNARIILDPAPPPASGGNPAPVSASSTPKPGRKKTEKG